MSANAKANIINLRNVDVDSSLRGKHNVYIGRKTSETTASKWKNPYALSRFKSHRKVIQLFEEHLKGIVQWIFLLAYVVVLISGYTLLFTGTKTDQYFLRYLQKHARILAVLKKRFIQEMTAT